MPDDWEHRRKERQAWYDERAAEREAQMRRDMRAFRWQAAAYVASMVAFVVAVVLLDSST